MNEAEIAIELLGLALKAASGIEGLVTEQEKKNLQERIARARAAIHDPTDTSATDAERRARLERVLAGEEAVPPANPFEDPSEG